MAADFFLVIPAYREVQRLPAFLRALGARLAPAEFTTEILIVDDGSPREEQRQLLNLLNIGTVGSCRILDPLFQPDNLGKGHSIIEGWRRAGEATWLGFVDADGGTPADEVLRLFRLARENQAQPSPCLWAARVRMLGRRTNRTQARYLLGRIFANAASAMLGVPVYDSQCGFKLLPAVHYRKLAPLLREPRFCFDLELLLAALHVGAPVLEVPVDWQDMPGGHIHPGRDGLAMLRQLPVIRRRARAWPPVG
jgi:glycosyltransferase involved in cell wall biosynthesis